MKEIIKTADLPKREEDDRLRPGGGFIMTGTPPVMGPVQYIERYGQPNEIQELVGKIERRRAKLPRFTYWICQSCGRKSKRPYDDRDFEPDIKNYCILGCNPRLYVDGGVMRQMTAKEAVQYEKDEAERFRKSLEQAKRAEFFAENQSRQQQGLEPLSREEWDENRRKGWQAQRAAERRLNTAAK